MEFLENVTNDEIRDAILDLQESKYKSKFGFLKATNGIRPSAISFLLGTAGGGKSTLFKSIVSDISKTKDVILWLSEEDKASYSIGLKAVDKDVNLSNIHFFQETKYRKEIITECRKTSVMETFDRVIRPRSTGIVMFDNITTSCLYDGKKPDVQASILAELRDYTIKENLALFCAAHSQKNVNGGINRLMAQEDIQGSRSATKTAAYFYILQLIDIGNAREAFVMLSKHRGFNPANKFFRLKFSDGSYVSDREVPFDVMKECWRSRNKLDEKGSTGEKKYGR